MYLFFVSNISSSRKSALLMILGGSVFFIYLQFSEIVDAAIGMYEYRARAEEASGNGMGGGRIGKYEYFLSNINLLPIGVGYSLLRDGVEFHPHSDLIRINFSYGLPFLLLLGYIGIPRVKKGVLLFLVFSVPFLVNTVIDDYKLLPLYLFISSLLYDLDSKSKARFL